MSGKTRAMLYATAILTVVVMVVGVGPAMNALISAELDAKYGVTK